MKLRIKGNSVRLRLSKTEVDQIASVGMVQEQTIFGDDVFTYQLLKKNTKQVRAVLENNCLTVYIPDAFADKWAGNNVTGIDNKAGDGSLPQLYILIEKDFKCIDNSEEDQSDNYDNPKAC